MARAVEVGCTKLIVTGSSMKSSRNALQLAKQFREHFRSLHFSGTIIALTAYPYSYEIAGTVFTTAGIHPCSSSIFGISHQKHHDESEGGEEPEDHTPACGPDPTKPIQDGHGINHTRSKQIIKELADLIAQARTHTVTASPELVAFGEFGLDYDRLHFCSKEAQLHSFAAQLELAASLSPQLPLFLHSRAAHADFVRLLKDAFGPRLERLEKGGVVHSFTGTAEEMRELMDLGLYIGINGCSFKTAENCDVVREVDLSRLMIETDGPWCEVRPAHEGWKYLVEWEAKAKAAAEAAAAAAAAAQAEAAAAAAAIANLSVENTSAETTPADTPTPEGQEASGTSKRRRPRKSPNPQNQQQQAKKNQKKEPEVPDRFKVVKKEKWVEGAMVKGRNEPCTIERIARIIAGIKGVSEEEVCEAAWANTVKVFEVDS